MPEPGFFHVPFSNISGSTTYTLCAKLSEVGHRSLVPGSGIDVQRIAQAGFATFFFCTVKDFKSGNPTWSGFPRLDDPVLKKCKDDDRLFYCGCSKKDAVGQDEVGPLTTRAIKGIEMKTVLTLSTAKSLLRCNIPRGQAKEWEPGYSGKRTLNRTSDYQMDSFPHHPVGTLQELSEDKPSALIPSSQLNFVELRKAGFSSMGYVKANPVENPSTSASHDGLYYVFTLTGDGKVSPVQLSGRTSRTSVPLSVTRTEAAKWMLSVSAPVPKVLSPPPAPVPVVHHKILRVPVNDATMQRVHQNFTAVQMGANVEAEAFCHHKPMSIGLVNTYMRLLRKDEHRDRRSCYLDAVDMSPPFQAKFLQELFRTMGDQHDAVKHPDRIFLPCWTKEHVSLLVIKPKAEPKPMIEVWDPVPNDERFNWLESHVVILVIKQHIGATMEIELTHATKLPFVVEKQESGVIALMVARRLSRHTSESEKAAMKGLLSLEASQSWEWESKHIAQMRKMMFREMFELGRIVEPPHNLVESAPYGPFH